MNEAKLKKAIEDAITNQLTQFIAENKAQTIIHHSRRQEDKFFINPETHYKEHIWLQNLIGWHDKVKTSTVKTTVRILVTGILGLIVAGFILFFKT